MLEHWLKLFRDWLHRYGHQAAYLWVREGASGDHAHILLHLPPGLRLGRSQQWTARAAGGQYTKGGVKTVRIRGTSDPTRSLYAQNLVRVVNYVMKGAAPAVAAKLDIRRRAQGRLYGKRCGVSRSLGRKARSDCSQVIQSDENGWIIGATYDMAIGWEWMEKRRDAGYFDNSHHSRNPLADRGDR